MSDRKLEMKILFTAVDKFLPQVRAITKGAAEASKAFKTTRDRIKELDSAVAKIDAFKKAERDGAIAANAFKSTQDRIAALRAEIDRVGVPTKAMSQELEKLTQQSDRLQQRHEKLAKHEEDLRRALHASGIETRNLAETRGHLVSASADALMMSRKLAAAVDAEAEKTKRLNAARRELAKSLEFSSRLRGVGAGMMATGAGVAAAGAVPVLAYAKAEDSATQLMVAMMQSGGKVSEQFREINDLAERLGNRLPGATSDYQDMMTMLIRQGMPAKNILGGLGEATAYLAVQLKMAPTAAAEFASKLQDATRTADKDMMALMDTIQKGFYLGVDQNNMLQGFAKLSPALSILRKEGAAAAKELAPLLIMADQNGMAGEAAGNAYRKIFQMAMDAKHVQKGNTELAGTGVKLDFTDGKGEFGGLGKMYQQLDKLKNVNTQQRLAALKKIFGDDAETLQALTIMVEKGAGGYREVQAKMAAQAGLQERVNAQLQTLKNLWDAATGTFTNALVAFGESIAPELHAVTEWLGKLAEKTQAWAKENPAFAAAIMTTVKWLSLTLITVGGLVTGLAALAAPVAMAKFAFSALGISGFGAASLLARGFNLVMSGIGLIGRTLLLNPIGLAISGIALAAYLIYKYWDPIKSFFSGLWDSIKTGMATAWDWIRGKIVDFVTYWTPVLEFVKSLPGKLMDAGAAVIDGFISGLEARWDALKSKLAAIGKMIPLPINKTLDIHSPSRVFAKIGAFTMQGFEQGLKDGEDGPLQAVSDMAKKIAGIGAGVAISGAAMATGIPMDTRPPLSTSQAQASSSLAGGNTFIFQIYAAPGMDERALAQAVRREVESIARQDAVRGRSRLRDMD